MRNAHTRLIVLAVIGLIVGLLAAPSTATVPDEPSERMWEHIAFSMGEGRFLANGDSLTEHLDFRRAIAHALDRTALADTMGLTPIDSYVDVYNEAISQDAWAQYDYDPAQAQTLLADLCTELNRNCTFEPPTVVFAVREDRPNRVALSNAMKPMLEDVGIEVILDIIPWSEQVDQLVGGTFDLADFGWLQDGAARAIVDIHEQFDPDSENIYGWGSPGSSVVNSQTERFADLVDQLQTTTNQSQLTAFVREAEEILADQVVFIPLGYKPGCRGFEVTIMGTSGADELTGTPGPDVIDGGGGDDVISGLGGDDVLCGGPGNDTLRGGLGNDELAGGIGDDLLRGNAGDDILSGSDGQDRLQEGAGSDSLYGEAGKDKLWGGIGNDYLDGGDGNDQLRGGPDDDSLVGDDGTDRMWGDAGFDSMFGDGNSDFMYGGIGNDTMVGGDGNDRMYGWSGNDRMWGFNGNDQLRGQAGDDEVNGGPHYDWCSQEIGMTDCEVTL